MEAQGYGYVPNTMEQTAIYFRRGLYTNTLPCTVGDDGTLRIGVRKTQTIASDWCIFDHFTLTRLIDETPTAITKPQPITTAATYDLQGRRVEHTQHGVYIQGGRKIMK